ncbi:uncharacterized protein LOC109606908 [Aethina tumida]|uniref:uncharacterized protein LOC109606908 n=1 Tax=Aethina tumida TaxID=116153 RepID=UPI00214785DC|nr:uncharacterized protein LOC109606908 [Aethina tumida]
MKTPSSPPPVDDCDDIFGPPRTYPGGYCPPKTRPSMISAKYRQKEERRKILKISANKLKKIEDPEISLHRSVLINNIMKHLQQDARDERYFKNQLNYPRFDNDHFLNLKSEFMKNEGKSDNKCETKSGFDEQDFDTKVALEMNKAKAVLTPVLVEENLTSLASTSESVVVPISDNNNRVAAAAAATTTTKTTPTTTAPKRTLDEVEDCDVQDVLSQCYMPPTPRMLTGIDDSEDEEPIAKKPKLNEGSVMDARESVTEFCVSNYINNNNNNNTTSSEARLARFVKSNETESFSCGHASMFSDLQSNVYHNLIASLET